MKVKIALIFFIIASIKCSGRTPVTDNGPLKEEDVLISVKFIDDNTYLIICKGYPQLQSDGIVMELSAEKAAQLNALYFAGKVFNDSVDPVRAGTIQKYKNYDGYVVIYYRIRMNGLKNMLRE